MKERIKEIMEEFLEDIKESSNKKQRGYLILGAVVFAAICCCAGFLASGGSNRSHPVYISEILASNTRYPNADGICCDYVELYNSAGHNVDISGFSLSDGGSSTRYEFPSGTVMVPGEYLVVYCDKDMGAKDYARFGISRGGGERIYLLNSNGAVSDQVVTLETGLNQAMIRLDSGEWSVSPQATPGDKNDEQAKTGQGMFHAEVSAVRISELMASNSGYANEDGLFCDWVELYNTTDQPADISGYSLSDNVNMDKFVFPEGTVLSPGGYLVVNCTTEETGQMIAPFGLSQFGGESVVLKTDQGKIADIVDCVPLDTNQSLALGNDDMWGKTRECTPGFENTEQGYRTYLTSIGVGKHTVEISEIMSAEQTVLADRHGQFPDWIELHNISNEDVDLQGWFLSDDPEDPTKWELPRIVLRPDEYLTVFCSGKDSTGNGELHTNFSLASNGEAVVLSSPLGVAADSVEFGKAEQECAFARSNETGEMALTRYPTPGYPNDMAGYEEFCASLTAKGPIAIWEVMTTNESYLAQELGNCYDWVELRNVSDREIDLSNYSLTDDPDDRSMYTLPQKQLAPGESIAIILSGDETLSNFRYDHAGFALNAAWDKLLLFSANGELLDYVLLRDIPLTYSYGRSADVGGFFYMTPTPLEDNASGCRLVSEMPQSNTEPGVYVSQTGAEVSFSSGGTVYYTLDGSDPTSSSLCYSGPIQINETAVLRAVSIEEGKLQSDIYTSTFIIADEHSIPVVSLVTDPDNLWGPDGIYKSYLEVKELKRGANISYLGTDGSFSTDCEISLRGVTSIQAQEKKSFTVRFQDSYDGPLRYDVFEDGEITTFASLVLRADQESTYSSYMRDNLFGYVASNTSDSLISQKTKYVALYINGEYWGIYSLREHHSTEHYASYMQLPHSSVSMYKGYPEANTSLYHIHSFCKQNSLESDRNYAYVASQIDVNSFADWIIFEAYSGNFDIFENMRYYYSSADGLWRCGLSDLDLGMFRDQAFGDMKQALHHGVYVSALFQNEQFRDLLARRLAELLSGPMSDENMIANIDMLAAKIRQEMPREKARWGGSVNQWEGMVRELKYFCDGRGEELVDSICSVLDFTPEQRQTYFGQIYSA